MDFNLPAENDPRRLEVREWFIDNPNATLEDLAKKGYAAPNWPAPWGVSADPELQLIVEEETERAGLPVPARINPVAVNQCGQTVVHVGTEEQKRQFLPDALACRKKWCMLFSEPSAGSDLASLRTTARREGNGYVISGQKTWNSAAHNAQIGVIIARTDPTVPKHKGLSVFIIDMDAPGVDVRPIHNMTGRESEFNEVFLNDVKVSGDRLLGEEGQGWGIVLSQLQTERMAMTKPGAVWGWGPTARELVHGLMATDRLKDPYLRDEAAKLYIEGELLRLLTYRNLSNRLNGKPAGLEGNIGKMVASPHGQRLSDLAKQAVGASGMFDSEEYDLPLPDRDYGHFSSWEYSYWFAPAGTLGVGTQEILKNSVSERSLGLPRDIDPSSKVPYTEMREMLKAVG